jgi:hypothetical protein
MIRNPPYAKTAYCLKGADGGQIKLFAGAPCGWIRIGSDPAQRSFSLPDRILRSCFVRGEISVNKAKLLSYRLTPPPPRCFSLCAHRRQARGEFLHPCDLFQMAVIGRRNR